MKILFLDIDGVLNYSGTKARDGGYIGIDPDLMPFLNMIVERTDCKIVISSTWRNMHTIEQLKEKFEAAGFKYGDYIIDKTPTFHSSDFFVPRGCEIKSWLDSSREVESFAIVDDNSDMLLEHRFNFVKTSERTGLTALTSENIIQILNKK